MLSTAPSSPSSPISRIMLNNKEEAERKKEKQSRSSSVVDLQREYMSSLDIQRKALESEAQVIVEELSSPGADGARPMGIDTPLVDAEGYPRADIDVYRARTLRHRLAVIRTDHTRLMQQLEISLVKLAGLTKSDSKKEEEAELQARQSAKPKPKFDKKTGKWVVMNWDGSVAGIPNGDKKSFNKINVEENKEENEDENNNSGRMRMRRFSSMRSVPSNVSKIPFCKINAVAPGSPAAKAGMKEGDLVCQFGNLSLLNQQEESDSFSASSHGSGMLLQDIGKLVPEAAASKEPIVVMVQRHNADEMTDLKQLVLRPRPWKGRGLLGCHIVPLHDLQLLA